MAAPANQIDTKAINFALDQEFVANYKQEYDRLAEIMGLFGVETKAAGSALYQLKIEGSLNNAKTDDSSSGTAYVEGDLVALSKYTAKKVPMGDITAVPYRKQTTAAAIQKSGYDVAVLRTDRKMLAHVRAAEIAKFFAFLANGTGTAEGATLQATLANVDATLADTLEQNDDNGGTLLHFMNRQDAAAYLGAAEITTQTVYGMTYLQNFLGVERVFLSAKVPAGTVYATTAENVHVYGLDFSELSRGGLSYATQSDGLVGVAHTPAYDHVSTDTNVLCGSMLFPEVQDYIVKGSINPK